MKMSVLLVAVWLVACEDLPSRGMGADPGMDSMGDDNEDPRDDPFLADINNAWVGAQGSFNFQATPGGKISSSVVRGTASVQPYGSGFVLDGVFYDHMVHLTATSGATVLILDGMFLDVARMRLTVKETQARISLGCTTSPPPCM